MKIGLFFGSFNPVHIGHMVIGSYMAEFADLDSVWFVVSPHNPLKEKSTLLANNHRLQLVQMSLEDNKKLKASNIEFKLPKPSYTINTLTHLKEKYPNKEFVLILGTDNLETFHKWKNFEQLLDQYELYVYPRPGYAGGSLVGHPKVKVFETPVMQISSSFIRQAVKDKKDVRYMMRDAAYQYMKEMHFYEK